MVLQWVYSRWVDLNYLFVFYGDIMGGNGAMPRAMHEFAIPVVHIAEVVKELPKAHLASWYQKLLPRIQHNFENWKVYARRQQDKMINKVEKFLC